jgi:hypothetical protein
MFEKLDFAENAEIYYCPYSLFNPKLRLAIKHIPHPTKFE